MPKAGGEVCLRHARVRPSPWPSPGGRGNGAPDGEAPGWRGEALGAGVVHK